MIDFAGWLGDTGDLAALPTATAAQRAVQAWRRIQDKPTSVVFETPGGTVLAAQEVRIESDNTATPAESAAGLAPRRKVVVFGVQGHPTVADTDMGEGFTFVYGNDEYRIQDIIETLGEVQGIGEASG